MSRLHHAPGSHPSLICNAVVGCSLGLAALILEDKRRQIAFLQRVIDNTKKLQQQNAHPLVARIETVSIGNDDEGHNPSFPSSEDGSLRTPNANLKTTKRWMIRKRVKRRPLGEEDSGTSNKDLGTPFFMELDTPTRRQRTSSSSNLNPLVRHDERRKIPHNQSVLFGGRWRPKNPESDLSRVRPLSSQFIHTSQHVRAQAAQVIYTEGSFLTGTESRYTRYLEDVLAARVQDCLASHDTKMHKVGIQELVIYLKQHRGRVTPILYNAIKLSYRKITEPNSSLAQWNTLAESSRFKNAIMEGPTEYAPFISTSIESRIESEIGAQSSERGVAARISKYLRGQWLYAAAFEVWNTLEKTKSPVSSELRRAIDMLLSALKESGAFSIVKDIQMKLLELNDLQLDLNHFSWLIQYEIPENTSQLCLRFLKKLYPGKSGNEIGKKTPGANTSLNRMIQLCFRKKLYNGILELVQWVGLETACGCGRPDTIYCAVQKAGSIKSAREVIEYLPDWTTARKYHASVTHNQPGMLLERVIDTHRRLLRRCWWDTGDMALTEEIFEAIQRKLQKPTMLRWIHPVMIRAYVEAGKADEAQSYVNKVLNESPMEFRIDLIAELILIHAAKLRWDKVEQMWQIIEQNTDALNQCRRDPRVLHNVFQQYCNRNPATEALSYVLGVSQRLGFILPPATSGCLMDRIIYDQDGKSLNALLSYLRSKGLKPLVSRQSLQRLVSISGSKLAFHSPRVGEEDRVLTRWETAGLTRQFEGLRSNCSAKQVGSKPAASIPSTPKYAVRPGELSDLSDDLEAQAVAVRMGPPPPRGLNESRTEHLNAVMRIMLERMRSKKPIEALQTYRSSLVHGLPRHDVDLCLAVQAMLDIDPKSTEAAEVLIDSAKANGMNVFRAYQPLLLHSIKTHSSRVPTSQARQIIHNFYHASSAAPLKIPMDHHVTVAIVRHLLHSGKSKQARKIMNEIATSDWVVRRPFGIVPMTLMLQICINLGLASQMQRVMRDVLDRNLRIDSHFFLVLRAGRNRYRRALKDSSLVSRVESRALRMCRLLESYLEQFRQRKDSQQRRAKEFQSELVESVTKFCENGTAGLIVSSGVNQRPEESEWSHEKMPGPRMEALTGYEILAQEPICSNVVAANR